jgi:hypothetical protein
MPEVDSASENERQQFDYYRIYKLWQKAKTTETERVEKLLTTMLSAPLIAKEYKPTRELLDDARTVEDRKKDVTPSQQGAAVSPLATSVIKRLSNIPAVLLVEQLRLLQKLQRSPTTLDSDRMSGSTLPFAAPVNGRFEKENGRNNR